MKDMLDITEVIVSSWVVSGEDKKIPTSHGLLDKALKRAVDQGAFPDWARNKLHFADSRIGLQCVELPHILNWAQRAELTKAPNPSYQTTEVQISSDLARRLLKSMGIATEQAKQWGEIVRKEIKNAEKEFDDYNHYDLASEG